MDGVVQVTMKIKYRFKMLQQQVNVFEVKDRRLFTDG